jgi:ABC-2 type transport system permease protein
MVRYNSPQLVGTLDQVRLEVFHSVRGPRFLVLGIAIPLVVYVVYLLTGIGGATDELIRGIAWPSYLMVSMAAFGAMSAAVGVAAGWRRAADTSLVVRAVSAMLIALPPLLVVALAAALDGLRLPSLEWLLVIASLWLGAVPFAALGLLLGPMLDADSGDIVLLGILVPLAILGGLFQPIETFPTQLAGLAHVLPSYRLADLGWTALADHSVDPVDVLVLAGYTVGFGAAAVWRKRAEDAQVGE